MRPADASASASAPQRRATLAGLGGDERGLMRRMLATLLLAGATFALGVWLIFPDSIEQPVVNASIAGVAATCALVLLVGGARVPLWFLHLVPVFGTVAVTVAVVNNTQANNDDELYYLWVVLFASYFFPRRVALAHLGLIAVAYAVAIAIDEAAFVDDRARWLMTVTTLTVSGLVVNQLAARQRAMIGQLNDAVRTDPLTGLLNRHGFQEAFSAQLAAARRSGGGFALLVADLDHFKSVNDRLGHAAGDEVLRRVARLLSASTRGGDRPARLGGEEFALLAPDLDRRQAIAAAERVRRQLEQAFASAPEPVTVSIGVAVHPADGDTTDALMVGADSALYAAKAAGRNRVRSGARAGDREGIGPQPSVDGVPEAPKSSPPGATQRRVDPGG